MKFVGVVFTPEGIPLPKGAVDVVAPEGASVTSIGRGAVLDGELSVSAEPGAIWGLWIDKKPVLTLPVAVSSKGDTVDLGEINLLANGVNAQAFHAPDGKVFGLPFFDPPAGQSTEPTKDQPSTTIPRDAAALKTGLTFSGMVGSTAQQLGAITALKSGFNLTGASVRVRGVPTVLEDAIGLDFPNAELAATGVGLSELTFTMKPPPDSTPPTDQPSGTTAPDLTGYTRELATRKLNALGLLTDISTVIVQQATQEGRVVRQVPAARTTVPPGSVVRLFVGKRGGA